MLSDCRCGSINNIEEGVGHRDTENWLLIYIIASYIKDFEKYWVIRFNSIIKLSMNL